MNIFKLSEIYEWQKEWKKHIINIINLSYPHLPFGSKESKKISLISLSDNTRNNTIEALFLLETTIYGVVVSEYPKDSIICSISTIHNNKPKLEVSMPLIDKMDIVKIINYIENINTINNKY